MAPYVTIYTYLYGKDGEKKKVPWWEFQMFLRECTDYSGKFDWRISQLHISRTIFNNCWSAVVIGHPEDGTCFTGILEIENFNEEVAKKRYISQEDRVPSPLLY